MPPHCDSLDGPVVRAARYALEQGEVALILPYVPEEAEAEVVEAFEYARRVRELGAEAREVADRYFFETAVRLHRAGEGAPYTGLKPAGLDHGPVLPVAEGAIEAHSGDGLAELLSGVVREQVHSRLERVIALEDEASKGVRAARAYVEATLAFQVWAHGLYLTATGATDVGELEVEHAEAHHH